MLPEHFLQSLLGWVGLISHHRLAGRSRGLIQLIVEAFGGKIPSSQGTSVDPVSPGWRFVFQTSSPCSNLHDILLAALRRHQPALYEAASIEGANKRQVFKQITRPLLKPITMMIVVLGTIGTLQVFDQVYLATSGGPLKTSLTPVYLIFTEALGVNGPITMGYASALAFILAAIIFALTFVQRRILTKGTEMY